MTSELGWKALLLNCARKASSPVAGNENDQNENGAENENAVAVVVAANKDDAHPTDIVNYIDGEGNISIDSNSGEITEKPKPKKSRNDKRDRSGTSLDTDKTKRSTIIKKRVQKTGKKTWHFDACPDQDAHIRYA